MMEEENSASGEARKVGEHSASAETAVEENSVSAVRGKDGLGRREWREEGAHAPKLPVLCGLVSCLCLGAGVVTGEVL